MLKSLFTETSSSLSIWTILLCSVVSLLLGVAIAYTHKKTSKYNQNFLVTLAILPILVQTVMIMVNGNLGTSVAILGAFSLIRFRSLPGTSKEILSIFFSMTIGLATGMGHIVFAIIITLIIILAIFILYKTKIFKEDLAERILKVTIPENMDYNEVFETTFNKYLNSYNLENVKLVNMGSLFELTYRIKLKEDINEKEFLDDVRVKNSNLKISLSHKIENNEF